MGTCRHGVKQLFRRVLGMAGHEADAVLAGNLINIGQQVRKIIVNIQVIAVGVDVLAQQSDVLVPGLHQFPDLLQHTLRVPAPFPAPDIGDDAVGAKIVAAVHDGDPGFDALLPHHGDALGDGAMLVIHGKDPFAALVDPPQELRELPQGVGSEHQVHQGIGLFDALGDPLLLGHTAAEGDDHFGVFLFGVGQGTQVAEDPVFGVLPDGAGVQNHQVRLGGLVRQGEAAGLQHTHELLAVGHVLLAAEGVHAGHRMGLPGGKHIAYVLFKFPLAGKVRFGNQYVFAFQCRSSEMIYFN